MGNVHMEATQINYRGGSKKMSVEEAIKEAGGSYVLPTASADTLGGVKVGDNLTITDGVLSATGSSYVLPTASADTLGGVKVGSGLSITDGVLSATGGGGGVTVYHDTYTGTGSGINNLVLTHTPILILSVARVDGGVSINPYAPSNKKSVVGWTTPDTGFGWVNISNNGLTITGNDAGQACNTSDVEYEVYYLG